MPEFSTHLRLHGQVRDTRCLLCGALCPQVYVGVLLAEGGRPVGEVCPRCLSEPPCRRAQANWARAGWLYAQVGEALSRAEALREETASLWARVRADRRQRAQGRARREAERRQRLAGPGPATPEPEPATVEEKADLAELLSALAEGLGAWGEWPTPLAELKAAEAEAVQAHCPGLPEEEVSRGVEGRYRDFIARTA